MSIENRSLGRYGEDLAQKYLTACGYEILAQNYHSRFGEIDLIGRKIAAVGRGSQIVFFEVKTRKGSRFGLPEEAVDRLKIIKILKTAHEFLEKRKQSGAAARQGGAAERRSGAERQSGAALRQSFFQIDVISIQLNMYNMVEDLRHIKNIYVS
ncbi:YraN family protein [Candidatus Peregrinibacteria bacterium]|nr:YraN family protein [Candidatus Peregrinibacteria bacterium]